MLHSLHKQELMNQRKIIEHDASFDYAFIQSLYEAEGGREKLNKNQWKKVGKKLREFPDITDNEIVKLTRKGLTKHSASEVYGR